MSKTTYNEILNSMKNQFFDICGENVDLMGDLGARFQSVASEIFSLYCYGDFIMKQAFPQTATGEYLDYHAQMRNIERKSASKARGFVTFYINEASENDIEIKSGVICSLSDRPYIEFETTENVVLKAGDTQVQAEVMALEAGSDYNVAAKTVDTMVNPPSYIVGVTNDNKFTGGNDIENDYSLRKRIVSAYSLPATGVSLESIQQTILQFDEILDCIVFMEDKVYMEVYVRTVSGEVDDDIMNKINNAVLIAFIVNYTVEVWPAEPVECSLVLSAKCTSHSDQAKENITTLVKDYLAAMKIGENLNLNKLIYEISKLDYVEYCEIGSSNAVNNTVMCDQDKYLTLGDLEVIVYE